MNDLLKVASWGTSFRCDFQCAGFVSDRAASAISPAGDFSLGGSPTVSPRPVPISRKVKPLPLTAHVLRFFKGRLCGISNRLFMQQTYHCHQWFDGYTVHLG